MGLTKKEQEELDDIELDELNAESAKASSNVKPKSANQSILDARMSNVPILDSVGRGFTKGITAGYSPQIAGAVAGPYLTGIARMFVGLSGLLGGGVIDPKTGKPIPAKTLVPGKSYLQARDEYMARDSASAEQNPFTTFGTELLGGAAMPMVAASKAKSGLAALAKGAKIGGLTGLLMNPGDEYGEVNMSGQVPERLVNAAGGALIGGTLGTAGNYLSKEARVSRLASEIKKNPHVGSDRLGKLISKTRSDVEEKLLRPQEELITSRQHEASGEVNPDDINLDIYENPATGKTNQEIVDIKNKLDLSRTREERVPTKSQPTTEDLIPVAKARAAKEAALAQAEEAAYEKQKILGDALNNEADPVRHDFLKAELRKSIDAQVKLSEQRNSRGGFKVNLRDVEQTGHANAPQREFSVSEGFPPKIGEDKGLFNDLTNIPVEQHPDNVFNDLTNIPVEQHTKVKLARQQADAVQNPLPLQDMKMQTVKDPTAKITVGERVRVKRISDEARTRGQSGRATDKMLKDEPMALEAGNVQRRALVSDPTVDAALKEQAGPLKALGKLETERGGTYDPAGRFNGASPGAMSDFSRLDDMLDGRDYLAKFFGGPGDLMRAANEFQSASGLSKAGAFNPRQYAGYAGRMTGAGYSGVDQLYRNSLSSLTQETLRRIGALSGEEPKK